MKHFTLKIHKQTTKQTTKQKWQKQVRCQHFIFLSNILNIGCTRLSSLGLSTAYCPGFPKREEAGDRAGAGVDGPQSPPQSILDSSLLSSLHSVVCPGIFGDGCHTSSHYHFTDKTDLLLILFKTILTVYQFLIACMLYKLYRNVAGIQVKVIKNCS